MTNPVLDPRDPKTLLDPFTAHSTAREQSPIALMPVPGLGDLRVATRHDDAKAVLSDPRLRVGANSFTGLPGIPAHCLRYMRTMSELNGPEHQRVRRLATPAFTARRAAGFRPRITELVTALLDALPDDGEADLLADYAAPLPSDVVCELVGIPEADRERWRAHGSAVVSGNLQGLVAAVPDVIEGAKAAIAHRRAHPGDDLLSWLLEVEDGLTDTELVTLVWHLVLAGQTPANLVVNALEALLTHPDQLALLRERPELAPRAVEELTRWASPQLMATPRFAAGEVEVGGEPVPAGAPVVASLVGANRDPRAYTDPDRLDLTRAEGGHLAYGHGPHFCLGAAFAKVETEVAITELLARYPVVELAETPERVPDGGTWRLASLRVRLSRTA
ncbi:cytochrome P450 family protein [Actinosynnema pretiosum]|uniref:Cytochrome P450 n=1 Tax=Actinosynnema pretiosum TaxID=42197 RepID=A0A290Z3Z0_9PSEU|nr:cytochrome P450 [Actinosynnema pretiosum]ATE53718.1 cytochrome P450 [Actinosynnema pretiosum]